MSRGMHEVEMAVARAAVQLVGAEPGSHEFLKKIELFVGAAGRDETGNCVGSMLALDVGKPINHVVHGFEDRKSTRLNSSHVSISYAVFCLKKKNQTSTRL